MKREVPKKYMLVFEPEYDNYQYVVSFNQNVSTVTRIKKYTDISAESEKKVTVKKNLLVEIDRAVASLPDLKSLFEKYVDPKIFSYRVSSYGRDNLHKIFIGYKYNDYIYTLDLPIGNKELLGKLSLVDGNTINDHKGINGMVNLLLDENNGFFNYIAQMKKDNKTKLSTSSFNLISSLKNFQQRSMVEFDNEVKTEFYYLKEKLEDHLTSYHEYRTLFLLKQSYSIKLEEDRKILNEKRQALLDAKKAHEFIPLRGEQINIFGQIENAHQNERVNRKIKR